MTQPDGSLLCPANHPLFPQERRPERDGSLRVLYAARIGDCRNCALRAQCQESSSTNKPQRVIAVFWPFTSPQAVPRLPSSDHLSRFLSQLQTSDVSLFCGTIGPAATYGGVECK